MVSDSPDVVRGTPVFSGRGRSLLGLSSITWSWTGKHWAWVTFYRIGGCKMLCHYALLPSWVSKPDYLLLSTFDCLLCYFQSSQFCLMGTSKEKWIYLSLSEEEVWNTCFIATLSYNRQCPDVRYEAHLASFISVGNVEAETHRQMGVWPLIMDSKVSTAEVSPHRLLINFKYVCLVENPNSILTEWSSANAGGYHEPLGMIVHWEGTYHYPCSIPVRNA